MLFALASPSHHRGAVADAINESGGEAEALAVDVSSGEQIRHACEQLLEKHECVDVLVNNAGITRDNLLFAWKKMIGAMSLILIHQLFSLDQGTWTPNDS